MLKTTYKYAVTILMYGVNNYIVKFCGIRVEIVATADMQLHKQGEIRGN
jgi:hypothetical protein